MHLRRLAFAAAMLLPCASQADGALQNWFDDPFFQISNAIPDCPLPAGPFTDDADRRVQAHHRAEKGTTCWLTRQCEQPNAYMYDKDVAAALQAALRERNPFTDSTLWFTVQGRVVYIEGCARSDAVALDVERFARSVPNVQQAIANLRTDPAARPPYRVRPPN